MAEIGVITEQGDLGLGFNQISLNEEKTIKKNDEVKEMAPDRSTKK